MKVTDIWNSSQKPTISFELFPARSEKAAVSLEKAIEQLAALKPDFVYVTFGAGGSTREGSQQLLEKLKHEKGLEVVAYFACYGLGPEDLIAVLDSYRALDIENILCVRGDKPQEEAFEPHPDSLLHASDLVAFVRPRYNYCIGVAGYPEGHIEAINKEKDLEYLKLKVDQGAEYIITNKTKILLAILSECTLFSCFMDSNLLPFTPQRTDIVIGGLKIERRHSS